MSGIDNSKPGELTSIRGAHSSQGKTIPCQEQITLSQGSSLQSGELTPVRERSLQAKGR